MTFDTSPRNPAQDPESRKTALVRISCPSRYTCAEPRSPRGSRIEYSPSVAMSDLWQTRQISVSASLASRCSRQGNLGSKFCRTKHIDLIRASRRTLVPYLPYPLESAPLPSWKEQANGTELATRIKIFPPELRGAGEGSFMIDAAPGAMTHSRMTNGSVSRPTERQRHDSGSSLSGRRSDALRASEWTVSPAVNVTFSRATSVTGTLCSD
jgi:hypothetical protein